ncbi:hypothetical protein ABCA12_2423 [Acinetobacter junii]|uniref:BapA/Bap/LapF family prefix-like domain-containing protein n=1 Tax=Acinetobacter junii TaxID=40215 RepID=UPI001AF1ACEF|nr:hypothetical protein ABCA12_2423 [Acinetobacter junii]
MSEIQIISKESHKTLSTTMESTTTLPTEPSVVLLKVPMNDISVRLCCTNLLKADFTKSYQIQGTTWV